MKSCDDVLELLPDQLLLLRGETLEVLDHLRVCPECAEALDELTITTDLLHEHAEPAPELSPDLADRVLAALPPALPGDSEQPGEGAPAGELIPLPLGWTVRAAAAVAFFVAGIAASSLWQGSAVQVEIARTSPRPRARSAQPATSVNEGRLDPPRAPLLGVPPVAGGSALTTSGSSSSSASISAAGDGEVVVRTSRNGEWRELRLQMLGSEAPRDFFQEARLVMRALDRAPDRPDYLRQVQLYVDQELLLERGQRLLERQRAGQAPPELAQLIEGVQFMLVKLKNAPAEPERLPLFRQELQATGLSTALDDYLYTAAARPQPGPPTTPARVPAEPGDF